METAVSYLKDIFTLILVATATIISILAYRRARATVLQPIRSEVVKKQSEVLTEVLSCFSREKATLDERLDYVGVVSVSVFLTLRDYGFVLKDQEKIHKQIEDIYGGFIFCGES